MPLRSSKSFAVVLLAAAASTCALDESVLYACDANEPRCPPLFFCAPDNVCRPRVEGTAGGTTAGGSAGSSAGGSAGSSGGGSAGSSAGGAAGGDAGGQSGGSAGGTACVPITCGTLDCGYRPDGCGGTLSCSRCSAGTECGVRTPNRCDLVPGLCTPEGICWESLLPQGNDVRAVYSTDERHTWLATDNGSVLFFDGERTSMVPVPTQTGLHLRAIHGCGPNDIYVAGDDGTVFHFDGGAWAKESLPGGGHPELSFVHCLGNGAAITGRTSQQIFLRDAMGWTSRDSTFASSTHRALQHEQQLWLINDTGALLSANASSWQQVANGSAQVTFPRGLLGVGQKLYTLGLRDGGQFSDGGALTVSRLLEFQLPGGPWTTLVDVPGEAIGDQLNGFDTLDGEEFWLAGSLNNVRAFRRDGGLTPRLLSPADPRTLYAVKALGPNRAFITGSAGTFVYVEEGVASTTANPSQRLSNVNKLCIAPPMASTTAPAMLAPLNTNANLTRDPGPPVRWLPLASANVARSTNWLSCTITPQGDFLIGGTDGGLAFGSSTAPGSALTPTSYGLLDFVRVWSGPGRLWYALSAPRDRMVRLLVTDGGLTSTGAYAHDLDAGFVDLFGTGGYASMVGLDGSYASLSAGHFGTQVVANSNRDMNAVHGATQRDGGATLTVAAGSNGAWWSRTNTNAFGSQPPFTGATLTGVWVSALGTTYFVGGPPDGGGWLYVRPPSGVVKAEPLPLATAPSSIVGVDDFDAGTSTVWISGRGGAILRRDPKDGG